MSKKLHRPPAGSRRAGADGPVIRPGQGGQLPANSASKRRYIETHMALIAAYAWHGYREAGRGMVLILGEVPDVPLTPTPPPGEQLRTMTYLPLALARQHGWRLPGDSARMMSDYDPQIGAVVYIEEPGRRTPSVLKIFTMPRPPEAYEAYRERLPAIFRIERDTPRR